MNTSGDDSDPKVSEKAKKQRQLNAVILGMVFLLGIVLPPKYKALAPVLLLIPFIIGIVNKFSQTGKNPENPPPTHTYSPPKRDQIPYRELYTYKPKDPKDPRRYKPIG